MSVQIARVRARTRSGQQTLTRQRIDRLLRASALAPPGFPPSSILFVRRLYDPLPGLLPVDHPSHRPPAAWEQAVRERLSAHFRNAARPAHETVPASAEAVLFSDRAELLACLALDLRRGAFGERWWWRHLPLRRDEPASELLAGQMITHALSVPAAIGLLAAKGAAGEIAAWLPPRLATGILAAVGDTYGIDLRLASIRQRNSGDLLARPPGGIDSNHRQAAEPRPSPPDSLMATRRRPEPPWSMAISPASVPDDLAPEQQALLGVSLALNRAPAVVRSQDFQARLDDWWTVVRATSLLPTGDVMQPGSGPDASPATRDTTATVAPIASSADARPGPRDGFSVASKSEDPVEVASSPPDAQSGVSEVTPFEPGSPQTVGTRPSHLQFESISTRFGGIFYLLNLFTALDLLADLEDDSRLIAQFGPWDVLDALARGLLADQPDAHDDELWQLLAGLSGREAGQLPGHDLNLPSEWWLLATRHDHTGTVVALTLSGPLVEDMNAGLRAWLQLVLPRVTTTLIALLNPDTDDPSPDAITRLLRTPARIHITRTHIDVVMALDSISVAARLAGLDRDPGWLPDFGHVVQFHFE